MSRLDDLIAQYCPDGVKYSPIKDVYTRLKGTSITAGKMKEIDKAEGEIRIFAGGKTMINAHETDIPNANITKTPAVLVQSRGIIDFIYYDKPFTFKNEMWAYTHKDLISVKFLYYILKNNVDHFREAASGMGSLPQISLPVTENYVIPVPPLPVQQEIVRILDSFTQLTAELQVMLQEELQIRKKQYENYANRVLSFPNAPYISLGELCDIVDYRGKTPVKSDKGIFLVTAKNIRQGYIDYEKSQEYIPYESYKEVMHRGLPKIGDILITTEAPCGFVAQVDREDIALAQRVIKYRPKNSEQLDCSFLKYILLGSEFQAKLERVSTGGTVKGIKGSILHTLTIPVPDLEVQKRTVNILDHFTNLFDDLKNGLPQEIEARKKQYEYYRDKLLTFKEKKI